MEDFGIGWILLSLAVISIIALRFFGAWMFRIDEILTNQETLIEQNQQIIELLKKGAE
jgi:hypothetical protein